MGFKSTNKQTSQSNNSNQFQVGGLIFDCKDDYYLFINIDINILETIKIINYGCIVMEEYFNKIKNINVTESYPDAREEMYGIFENATTLLQYENTRYHNDYKVGCNFFSKINIIEYSD